MTWETCTLRKWLNDDFLNAAFTEEEQAKLDTVTVTADRNPEYSTGPGNDTQDKVYLLSIDEVNLYSDTVDWLKCMATKTAEANGAGTFITDSCAWWLRTPGIVSDMAAYVFKDGIFVENSGHVVNYGEIVVRPVVVLRLS